MRKNILYSFLICASAISLSSCSKDTEFTETIYDAVQDLDPTSYTYTFDKWLDDNYRKTFNISFKYKLQDVASNTEYNLIPTSYEKSQVMAKLSKYLWFDVYEKLVPNGKQFLRMYSPRIIHLIGSPAYNPASGTMLLGTAEGGLKITLYRCNDVDWKDVELLNEFYFKTMHHEFAHILHQKKTYPVEYQTISAGSYDNGGWQYMSDEKAAGLGFVSPYAGSQPREDFVEVIANYLVKTDADWNNILNMASKVGTGDQNGKAKILKKLEICRKWLKDAWKVDIELMRKEILEREEYLQTLNSLDDLFGTTDKNINNE